MSENLSSEADQKEKIIELKRNIATISMILPY